MPNRQRVSAAELVRNFGYWQEKALQAPVFITHHKRDRLVLTSIDAHTETKAAPSAKPISRSDPTSDILSSYALLVENMSDAYVVLDENLTIVAVNARLEAMWRVSREQIIGRPFNDFIPEEKAALLMEKIRRVMVTRQADRIEFASQVFHGLHLSTKIYPDPRGVVLLHTNVSELKQLRSEMALAESIKTSIDRHPQTAHARTDSRGRFTYSDETTQLWTGFDEETLRNTRMVDIVALGDRRRMTEAFDDVLTAHLPTALTVRIMGKDFREYDVLVAMAPIMAEHNVAGVTMVGTLLPTEALGETA
ncbi:MAG: PAS domain S-box protein [Caulobacterales bacterium]